MTCTDTAKINVIDFKNNTCTCSINNTNHKIKLGSNPPKINYAINDSFKLIKLTVCLSHANKNRISCSETLTSEQQHRVKSFIREYNKVFQNNKSTTIVYECSTQVTDENIFVVRIIPYYTLPKVSRRKIKSVLDNNIIERSNSKFLNFMIAIQKMTLEYV